MPRSKRAHYLSTAHNNRREWLSGETVRQKKYLHVLRALLAARWAERGLGLAFMEFTDLISATLVDPVEGPDRTESIPWERLGELLRSTLRATWGSFT